MRYTVDLIPRTIKRDTITGQFFQCLVNGKKVYAFGLDEEKAFELCDALVRAEGLDPENAADFEKSNHSVYECVSAILVDNLSCAMIENKYDVLLEDGNPIGYVLRDDPATLHLLKTLNT